MMRHRTSAHAYQESDRGASVSTTAVSERGTRTVGSSPEGTSVRGGPLKQLLSVCDSEEQRRALCASDRPLDLLVLLLLTAIAAGTRFWRLSAPNSVVFDEFHFGKFVTCYFTGEYFFDIHPPLGKLLLALGGYLHGYNTSFLYDQIGAVYPDDSYMGPRFVAALFGTLVVPLYYLVARALPMSVEASALAASWLLFDMATAIESRLILTDSQLVFFTVLHLYCMLRLWRTRNGTRARRRWLLWSGITAGLALSVKWTALATPGLAGLVSLFGSRALLGHQKRIPFFQCVLIGLVAICVYTSFFWLHFRLLPRSGSGDAFMLPTFRANLLGSPEHDPRAPKVPFGSKFLYLNKEMLRANAQVPGRHHWESKWWSWPLDLSGILYWIQSQRAPWMDAPQTNPSPRAMLRASQGSLKPKSAFDVVEARIYLLVNPIVAWSVLGGLLLFVSLVGHRLFQAAIGDFQRAPKRKRESEPSKLARRVKQTYYATGTFVFCGWLLNLLPYIGVKRAAFLYHYLPGLIYGILLTAWLLDRAPVSRSMRAQIAMIGILLSAAAYVYFSPWVYGLHLTIEQQRARRWLGTWI
ncbi:Dolichyl-phosphate-mannose--protein mannosyltransferase [Cyanidiococcus yangmingshanensis]|uniref:Dolichyl-phosphate-mannose--protein mannosyltransferase n=1 Tax=Cyanidiococcus yangmingshanensis TaxID=2690220 RepID=A0A7J7IGA9_9RHOD|nr:Dolichyl-phosphate-mannose--protein mannosyltransferase [Cyanidiococcus yangmingshanensis]